MEGGQSLSRVKTELLNRGMWYSSSLEVGGDGTDGILHPERAMRVLRSL